MYGIHPRREEILKKYRACYKKLGRTPGIRMFCRLTGVKKASVYYYWTYFDDLVREVGGTPNQLPTTLTDEDIFREYARVCLHVGKIPGQLELHHTARKIGARVYSIFRRFGGVREFDRHFRSWLLEAPEEFKPILSMPGWRRPGAAIPPLPPAPGSQACSWLPGLLRDLQTLAEKTIPPGMASPAGEERMFESRCADAFRAFGFEVTVQAPRVDPWASTVLARATAAAGGEAVERGREQAPTVQPRRWQITARTPEHTYGLVVDCEARQGKYAPPEPRERALFERVNDQVAGLRREEISRVYLACLGPSFRETDLAALVSYFAGSGLAGITLLSAAALQRLVEDSIRDRASFSLARFEAEFVGNNLIL